MINDSSNISSISQSDQTDDNRHEETHVTTTSSSGNIQQMHPLNQWVLQQRESHRKREEQEFLSRQERRRISKMKSWEIDQEYENYRQEQLSHHETWLDLEVQWLEDDYREHLQQIEHVEELRKEEEDASEMEQLKQWEDTVLQSLVTLAEKQSSQDLNLSQKAANST